MVETVQERMKRIEEQKKYIKEHEGLSKKALKYNILNITKNTRYSVIVKNFLIKFHFIQVNDLL